LKVQSVIRNEDVASAADADKVKIIKLFGSIEYPDTLVLTERNLIDLFDKSSRIFDLVVMALATYPLLMVGQPLSDTHFRRLYRRLVHMLGGKFHPSYALWSHEDEHSKYWQEYWEKENVQLINTNEERFLRYITTVRREIVPVSSGLPWVRLKANEPYKFLDYFEPEDADIFFGRKDDTNRCLQKILSHRLTVLCGKSGVGKTSLIKAGITPVLRSDGRYRLIYTRCGDDPSRSIKRALTDVVPDLAVISRKNLADFLAEARRITGQELIVLIDQFEEFFIKFGERVHTHFLREFMQCLTISSLTVRFVLSLREDYLSRLADLRDIVPMILYNVYRLKELSMESARDAIVEPARTFGISFESGLPETILRDMGSTEIAPPQIQIVCYKLYKSLDRATSVTHSHYESLGGIKQLLSEYLEESLSKFGNKAKPVRAVLKAMVTSEGTKSLLSISDLSIKVGLDQAYVEEIVDDLVNRQRLVRKVSGETGFQFELAHEYLTFKIWQWFSEEEIRQKEIQELMERELNSWRRFRHLRLGKDKLDIFNKGRHLLALDNDMIELLLLSSIRHLENDHHWIDRIQEMSSDNQDQIATSIMNVFSESDRVLRRQAAEALANIGTQPLLRALQRNDPLWKCAAIEMIGGLERKEAIAPLIQVLDDPSEDVRALACGALSEIGKSMKIVYFQTAADSKTLDLILEAIRRKLVPGESVSVRVSAIEALFQIADDKGVTDWLPLLLDDQPEVVKRVGKKLKSLSYSRIEEWPDSDVFVCDREFYDRNDPAILAIINALKTENHTWQRKIVGFVSTWCGCPKALNHALISESGERILSIIIKLLERIDDPDSWDALDHFIRHGNLSLRGEAERVRNGLSAPRTTYREPRKELGRINDVKELIASLNDRKLCKEAEDKLVRIAEAAIDKLIDALKHQEWRIRKHAALALGRIGDKRAAIALEELVDDEKEEVSKAAQQAVLQLRPTAKVWMKKWQKSFR
jgi:HEAT repeat protein